ncbi:MAG TPA: four helix bundle protein [Candidatus Kryptonia bacterium]
MSKVKGQSHRSNLKTGLVAVFEGDGFRYGEENNKGTIRPEENLKYRSYRFAVDIVKFVDSPESRSARFSIRDQLIRAATSVGANISEARAASSKRDFIRYYEIALKSSNETKFWLCLLRDAFGIDKSRIKPLLDEAKELSNMIAASVLTMKKKRQ